MRHVTEPEVARMRQDFLDGVPVSQILRGLALANPDFSTGHLIVALMDAFGVSHSQVTCLGGWWHCGISELSDEHIDSVVASAIEGAFRDGKWFAPPTRP